MAPLLAPGAEDAPFLRLWHGFLTGRVMVALTLLLLMATGLVLNQNTESWMVALCLAYLVSSIAARVMSRRKAPRPQAGLHWLPTIGVDLAVVAALQTLHSGGMNFTPLFGMPILMAAVMGTLTLALGTTAAVTLLLLGWATWMSTTPAGGDAAPHYLQAALTGTGYFIVAFLTHQLATRLVREQRLAHTNRMAAQVQGQVSSLVIKNLNDGVLVVDEAFTVRMANPAALALLGCTAHMQPPFSLLENRYWHPLMLLARRCFRQGQSQVADVNLLAEGQSPVGLHAQTWLTSTDQEHPIAEEERLCVVFLHDLREMQARLRTVPPVSPVTEAAAAAHEIRNPLAAIVQATALLEEDLKDPTHQRLTQMVQQNADRLARIAEEILDIARVKHQISHANSSTIALDGTVAQVWHDWRDQDPARRRGQLHLGAQDIHVEFDPEHLRRVLFNLLDNALRYMGPEEDSLQLSTRVTASGRASVQVWSDGAPLDQSIERHLFEPFFSSESRSSGLGLYICRELCERHGATIDYQRTGRTTQRGDMQGNAFTVSFRKTGRLKEPASLFDTVVV